MLSVFHSLIVSYVPGGCFVDYTDPWSLVVVVVDRHLLAGNKTVGILGTVGIAGNTDLWLVW